MKKVISLIVTLAMVLTIVSTVGIFSVSAVADRTFFKIDTINGKFEKGKYTNMTVENHKGFEIYGNAGDTIVKTTPDVGDDEGIGTGKALQFNTSYDGVSPAISGAMKLTIPKMDLGIISNYNLCYGNYLNANGYSSYGSIEAMSGKTVFQLTKEDATNAYGRVEFEIVFTEDNMAVLFTSGKSTNAVAFGVGTADVPTSAAVKRYKKVSKNKVINAVIEYKNIDNSYGNKVKLIVDDELIGDVYFDNNNQALYYDNCRLRILNEGSESADAYMTKLQVIGTDNEISLDGIISIGDIADATFDNEGKTISVPYGTTGAELTTAVSVAGGTSKEVLNSGVLSTGDKFTLKPEGKSPVEYTIIVNEIDDKQISRIDCGTGRMYNKATGANGNVPTWALNSKDSTNGNVLQSVGFEWDSNDSIDQMKNQLKLTLPNTEGKTAGYFNFSWDAGTLKQLAGKNSYLPEVDALQYEYGILEYLVNFGAGEMATILKTSNGSGKYFAFGIGTDKDAQNGLNYVEVKPGTTHKVVIQYPRENTSNKYIKMWVDDELKYAIKNTNTALNIAEMNFAFFNGNNEKEAVYIDEWKVTASNVEYAPTTPIGGVYAFVIDDSNAKLVASNVADTAVNYCMIVAQYESDLLTDCEIVNIAVPAKADKVVFRGKKNLTGKLRAFLVRDMTSIIPIRPCAE